MQKEAVTGKGFIWIVSGKQSNLALTNKDKTLLLGTAAFQRK